MASKPSKKWLKSSGKKRKSGQKPQFMAALRQYLALDQRKIPYKFGSEELFTLAATLKTAFFKEITRQGGTIHPRPAIC